MMSIVYFLIATKKHQNYISLFYKALKNCFFGTIWGSIGHFKAFKTLSWIPLSFLVSYSSLKALKN